MTKEIDQLSIQIFNALDKTEPTMVIISKMAMVIFQAQRRLIEQAGTDTETAELFGHEVFQQVSGMLEANYKGRGH